MHVRGHNCHAKQAVPSLRYGQVAVVKECRKIQQSLEEDELAEAHAEEDKHRHPDERREDEFAGMEPERRGRVHLDVRMVGPVKPPKKPDPVVQQMPEVHPDIEKHDDDYGSRVQRKGEPMGEP